MLPFVKFPLSDYNSKDEIRSIARENNLSVYSKSDSQDICFIPDKDYNSFIEKYRFNKVVDDEISQIIDKQKKEELIVEYIEII
jgi:tRNA-specific 2-thiouridylase